MGKPTKRERSQEQTLELEANEAELEQSNPDLVRTVELVLARVAKSGALHRKPAGSLARRIVAGAGLITAALGGGYTVVEGNVEDERWRSDVDAFIGEATKEHTRLRRGLVEQQVLQVDSTEWLGEKIDRLGRPAQTETGTYRYPDPPKSPTMLRAEERASRAKAEATLELFEDDEILEVTPPTP